MHFRSIVILYGGPVWGPRAKLDPRPIIFGPRYFYYFFWVLSDTNLTDILKLSVSQLEPDIERILKIPCHSIL